MKICSSYFVFQNVKKQLFEFGLVKNFYSFKFLNDFADLLPSLDFAVATSVGNHSLKSFYFAFQSQPSSNSLSKIIDKSIFKGYFETL